MRRSGSMGVKQKHTEYQRSYKSEYPSFTKVYESNVDYRALRRSTEHNHHVEPFDWDPSSETDSELGLAATKKASRRPASVPKHIYKHEKFNKKYKDRLTKLTQQFEKNLSVSSPKGKEVEEDDAPDSARSRDSGVQTDRVVHVDRAVNGTVQVYPREGETEQEPQANGQEAPEPDKPSDQGYMCKPCKTKSATKLRTPVKKYSEHVPKPRPMSAPIGRPPKKDPKDLEHPPFVPYGYKDKEKKTGGQKTYNVRASAEIHPSALLARKRRLAEIARREKLAKAASLAQKRKRALFNDFNQRVQRETADWATEYRSHYAGYDKGIYQQILSSRPVSRQHDPQLLITTW